MLLSRPKYYISEWDDKFCGVSPKPTNSKVLLMGKVTKRTIKFLAVCEDTAVVRTVLKHASDKVVKSICNAAANAATGEVGIPDNVKKYFNKYHKTFRVLISRESTVDYKREHMLSLRSRVSHLIPPLLQCVLNSIGTTFILDDVYISKVRFNDKKRDGPPKGETHQGLRSKFECTGED